VTGNGDFNPAAHDWGDTVFAIHPDGTGAGGDPLDTYTPSNYQQLQNADLDLGSATPAIVPTGSAAFPHIAIQSGKDAKLRIINLDNLSGQGGLGHVGGELSTATLPQGGEVQNAVTVWKDPAGGEQWVFVVSPTNGIAGLKLAFDAAGKPSLTPGWQKTGGGGSPLVANGVLYWPLNNALRALDPTTGNQLWTGAIGAIHWQSATIANGVAYIADTAKHMTAFSLP
jgi:outer membrane protein assembly factor BamB